MKVNEIIKYLLNFNMNAEIVFIDKNGDENHITNNSRDYIGNGEYVNDGKVRFVTTGTVNNK